jgi:peroxiredoxin Q/BCP
MNIIRSFTLLLTLACVLPAMAEELAVGDPAPDFSLLGSDGKRHALADFKGKQAVVLAWYPRAFTSGCTVECKSLAENGHLIREYDVTYFMASVDEVDENRRFAEETEADFPLLSDPDKQVAEAYGVLAMMGFAKRHTFYIGADGTILKIDRSISPATAAQDMAANLAALGIPKR